MHRLGEALEARGDDEIAEAVVDHMHIHALRRLEREMLLELLADGVTFEMKVSGRRSPWRTQSPRHRIIQFAAVGGDVERVLAGLCLAIHEL